MLEFPTVYIHNWKNTKNYEVYVGETNDILRRTREHYARKIMKYMSEKQMIYSAGLGSIMQKETGRADGERKCSGAERVFILSAMNILINL